MGRHDKGRDIVRQTFAGADGIDTEPNIDPLMQAVPGLVAEAQRIRANTPVGALAALVPLARTAIPTFATITAVLLLISLSLFVFGEAAEPATTASDDLNRLILTGSLPEDGDDVLLEALVGGGSDDG